MALETSKYLGGIGALLTVIGSVAIFGSGFAGVLDLIGIILLLIGLNGLANHYQERGIFNNALYGFLLNIVGGIAAVGTLIGGIWWWINTEVASLPFEWTDAVAWQEWMTANAGNPAFILETFGGLIMIAVVALVVLFVFAILSAFMYRRSFTKLETRSGVGMFGTAGLLLLIGAFLTIILIGFIIIWIAFILLIVAFFSLREQPAPTMAPPPPQ